MTERVPREIKELVARRAGFRCEYCGSPASYCPDPFSIEHAEPRHAGGSHSPDNLGFACQGCNNHKFTRTTAVDPVSGETVPLFHPRRHAWADHFLWSEDRLLMVGVSPIGRATIEILQLNRLGVVNLRRLLLRVATLDEVAAAEEDGSK